MDSNVELLTRGNVISKLLEQIRVEKQTKKLESIPPWFYNSFRDVLSTLNAEIEDAGQKDIDRYLELREERRRMELEFRTLFQLRMSKIARLALYIDDPGDLMLMTVFEKMAMDGYRNLTQKLYWRMTGKEEAGAE